MNKSNKIESSIQNAKSLISSLSVEDVELPNKALTNFELLDAVKKLKIR